MNYICNICGKECKTAQSLGGHKMIHLPKKEYICEYCGKVFFTSEQAFKHHVTQSHINKTLRNSSSSCSFNELREDCYCQYCNEKCKNLNSLKQHEIRCKQNPNRIKYSVPKTFTYKGRIGWSKGLTKETDERVKHISEGVNKYLDTVDHHTKGIKHTEEYKSNLSKYAIEHNYQSHFGKRKVFVYNGVIFDSSYELSVAESLDRNRVVWERPSHGMFKYIDMNSKEHTYTPDFYLPYYDVYIDPKNEFLIKNVNPMLGYSDIDKIKWVCEQNNIRVIVLDEFHLEWEEIVKLI